MTAGGTQSTHLCTFKKIQESCPAFPLPVTVLCNVARVSESLFFTYYKVIYKKNHQQKPHKDQSILTVINLDQVIQDTNLHFSREALCHTANSKTTKGY